MNFHDKDYVIISAHQPGNTKQENAKLQAKLLADILDLIGYDSCVTQMSGRYNGIEEESYAVIMPDSESDVYDRIQSGLIGLGDKYKQECILYVFNAPDIKSFAVFFPLAVSIKKSKKDLSVSEWMEVTSFVTETKRNYSFIQGKFFIAVDPEPMQEITLVDELCSLFDLIDISTNPAFILDESTDGFDCSGDCQTGIECLDCDQKI